eukprot:CAMPEP_0182484278 /NCGR_PEP_ID=MMETSP1319-20130603/43135_1 /TAXON_ID=172717 /ORGANISM="Bolidomonas pacifica, Strain RCC208" /LENGTH=92 /DNA_ID=CAMNT_0024686169 /DNA_START=178 /DNA_END=456 /DNA_ORIENTATION=+
MAASAPSLVQKTPVPSNNEPSSTSTSPYTSTLLKASKISERVSPSYGSGSEDRAGAAAAAGLEVRRVQKPEAAQMKCRLTHAELYCIVDGAR